MIRSVGSVGEIMDWSDQDLECARVMQREGFSIRAISAELDIPYSTLRSKLSAKPSEHQRADPEGIDLLRIRVEELELRLKTLEELVLPKPKKDPFEGVPQDLKLEAFRKRQRELAERAEYS